MDRRRPARGARVRADARARRCSTRSASTATDPAPTRRGCSPRPSPRRPVADRGWPTSGTASWVRWPIRARNIRRVVRRAKRHGGAGRRRLGRTPTAEDWAGRYIAWMALGGTNRLIPQGLLNMVGTTPIVGERRAGFRIDSLAQHAPDGHQAVQAGPAGRRSSPGALGARCSSLIALGRGAVVFRAPARRPDHRERRRRVVGAAVQPGQLPGRARDRRGRRRHRSEPGINPATSFYWATTVGADGKVGSYYPAERRVHEPPRPDRAGHPARQLHAHVRPPAHLRARRPTSAASRPRRCTRVAHPLVPAGAAGDWARRQPPVPVPVDGQRPGWPQAARRREDGPSAAPSTPAWPSSSTCRTWSGAPWPPHPPTTNARS